jgi:hypothetical protein
MSTLKSYALLLTLAALYLGVSIPTIPAEFQPFSALLAGSLLATAVALWIRWAWAGILYLVVFGVMAAWAAWQVVRLGPTPSQLIYLFAALLALSGYVVIQHELRKPR